MPKLILLLTIMLLLSSGAYADDSRRSIRSGLICDATLTYRAVRSAGSTPPDVLQRSDGAFVGTDNPCLKRWLARGNVLGPAL
jgi:hypothetical protein